MKEQLKAKKNCYKNECITAIGLHIIHSTSVSTVTGHGHSWLTGLQLPSVQGLFPSPPLRNHLNFMHLPT
jgi:hypothetical protein